MGTKNWGYIAAYAALVIGSALAIIFAQKPLSSTVVSLALFGFNLAALMFLIPQTLNYISNLNKTQQAAANNENATAQTNAEILQNTEILGEEIAKLTNRINELENQMGAQSKTLGSITTSQNAAISATTELVGLQTIIQNQITALQKAVEETTANQSQNATQPQGMPLAAALAGTAAFTPLTTKDLIAPTQTNKIQQNNETQAKNHEDNTDAQDDITAQPSQQMDLMNFSAQTQLNTTAQNQETQQEEQYDTQPIRLQVNLAIGENDVICVRGEGGGLDWQEGVPMRDVDDNLWEWVSTPTDSPITCQVYLNDEIAAFGEDLTLNPGQTQQISPSFPQVEA